MSTAVPEAHLVIDGRGHAIGCQPIQRASAEGQQAAGISMT